MKISVIIPCYNEEKYIEKCLKSLLGQTLQPLEIIVIDDGSTDKSKVKIQKLKEKFKIKNLVILAQKHQGPGEARNLGAKKAKGDILVFIDADMWLEKNYLKNLVKPIVEGKAVATFTKEEYVANPENLWSKCWNINIGWPVNLHIDPLMPDKADNFRAIFKKTFFQTKGYKNVGYGEDVTVLAQLPRIKAKLARGVVCYHFNPSSLSEVFFNARWLGKGETTKRNFWTLITFSLPNSLRRGCQEAIRNKLPAFLIFKIIFDLGVFIGIVERIFKNNHLK